MENDQWLRLPPEGEKCPVTGLYRTALAEILEDRDPLTGEKCVLSLEKRKEGASRGIRLINRQSLLDHLRRKALAQSGLRWADRIKNPEGRTVDEVVSNRLLFQEFLSADDCIPDEDWEENGKLATRVQRIQALLENGALVREP